MSFKLVPFVAALTLAGSAHAITVNMTDFTYGSPVAATMTGTGGSPSYGGSAGAFTGSLSDSPSPDARRSSLSATSSPTSFVAWCVELTQSFNFGVDYQYSMLDGSNYTFGNLANDPNDHRLTDLSRLFTAASQNHFVFNSAGSAAFQAGIWEIVYEHDFSTLGYSLTSGSMMGVASDPANQGAFNTVNGFLMGLGNYAADYHIDILESGNQQDFLVASVPEPETWALLVGGLGLIGVVRRRRKA